MPTSALVSTGPPYWLSPHAHTPVANGLYLSLFSCEDALLLCKSWQIVATSAPDPSNERIILLERILERLKLQTTSPRLWIQPLDRRCIMTQLVVLFSHLPTVQRALTVQWFNLALL